MDISYPYTIKKVEGFGYVYKTYNTLVDVIQDVVIEVEADYNKEKKLVQILEEMGFDSTYIFYDTRLDRLLQLYIYYSSNATPHAEYSAQIWFDSVIVFESLKRRLF